MSATGSNVQQGSARRSERRRLLLGTGVVAVSLVGLSNLVTGAFFTDSRAVGANTFTTGTVSLGVNPASAAITFSGMAPGDVVTAPITVSNTGTLAERYAVMSSTDATDNNFLASQLQMSIKSGVSTCSNAGFAASGSVLYGPGVLGSTAGVNVVGNPAQGQQTGDRNLAAGASETLCVQVALPTSTGNSYENKATTATFTFNGEQTTNNP